jgi:hypothetical protein
MRWLDLLFAHWPVDPDALAAKLPAGLDLDLRDGQAWLGIVPFTMADVAPRGVPALGRFSQFPEINVRTYVRHGDLPGIWFLSLDAASRPTVEGARRVSTCRISAPGCRRSASPEGSRTGPSGSIAGVRLQPSRRAIARPDRSSPPCRVRSKPG